MKIAVVGGGISGLAAAWELRDAAEVTLFEPGRLGGCIRTALFGGKPVDEGADAFITRSPEALELCGELGIESELVAPSSGRSMLLWGGRLRPFPEGLVLGVPAHLPGLVSSGILSPLGLARAALDLVLPRKRPPDSLTVRELVADRFGYQVADRLVDPLIGGIYAGWTGQLGSTEVTPQLVSAAGRSHSLMLGLRSATSTNDGPLFLAPKSGMGKLVDALVESLKRSGTSIVSSAVETIAKAGRGLILDPSGERFDAAVLATPWHTTKGILDNASGQDLSLPWDIPAASVVLLTAALTGVDLPGGVNGFLVPRGTGRLMTACSFGSNKWPHWSEPGRAVVRISAGRYGDDEAIRMGDVELTGRLIEEVGQALGADITPTETRVSRWAHAFPQYLRGHAQRVASAEQALMGCFPTITLTGSSYRGVGIPACIASGRRAARFALSRAATAAA